MPNSSSLKPKTSPLKERVRRANAICTAQDPANVLLISLHINAAGDGTRWHTATGWSCYTTKGHTLSDTLATCLYQYTRTSSKAKPSAPTTPANATPTGKKTSTSSATPTVPPS